MYDISQNPFCLYSVHRTSVSGERSWANGPLVSLLNPLPCNKILICVNQKHLQTTQ